MIVMDTHVWLWFLSNPALLSRPAHDALEAARSDNGLVVSSISAWEVALLVKKDRLRLSMDVGDWIAKSESLPFIDFLPVNNAVAVKSVNLPEPLHDDPADRLIIAAAMSLGASLVTKDHKIITYPHVETIW